MYFRIICWSERLRNLSNSSILRIALPATVSNLTVPLLGLVDAAIVGHLGRAAYIGAIAVGGMLFNLIYWSFVFLRMGTSGLTAQAFGQDDRAEMTRLLLRSLGVAFAAALLLILLQRPLIDVASRLMSATDEVEDLSRIYFGICVWGAPAVLGLYSFSGWFIGMQNSRFPMWISIMQNLVNIVISLALVYGLGYKVEGVAAGTVVAQYAGLVMAVYFWYRFYADKAGRVAWRSLWEKGSVWRFFQVNRDIFLRTLCLVAVTTFFTSSGAAQGNLTLAANALMMQFFLLFSYVMDGFAYAGEALAGRYMGAGDAKRFRQTVRGLFRWGVSWAILFTLIYAVGGSCLLALLTDDEAVKDAAAPYMSWVVAIPVVGFSAFLFDGIFIGVTATRFMLLAMVVAGVVFFAVYGWGSPVWGNHALWCAFLMYLFTRGLVQAVCYPKILRRL